MKAGKGATSPTKSVLLYESHDSDLAVFSKISRVSSFVHGRKRQLPWARLHSATPSKRPGTFSASENDG